MVMEPKDADHVEGAQPPAVEPEKSDHVEDAQPMALEPTEKKRRGRPPKSLKEPFEVANATKEQSKEA